MRFSFSMRLLFLLAFSLFAGNCALADQSSVDAKPIIGINTDVEGEKPEKCLIYRTYIDAISKAGGIPVLLPPMPESDISGLLKHVDAVMMIGGADYPPALYHQEKHASAELMKPARSDFDLALVKAVLNDDKMPFLGICAGCQALNIASGGSLTQDIPSLKPESKVKHASPNGWQVGFSKHPVELSKGSKLEKVYGQNQLTVVTSHHQCVDAAGKALTVVAKSEDGLPEAIEKAGDRFVLGVQWHPERDFPTNQRLFEEFVHQAQMHHNATR